jgi:hypothetical protein
MRLDQENVDWRLLLGDRASHEAIYEFGEYSIADLEEIEDDE